MICTSQAISFGLGHSRNGMVGQDGRFEWDGLRDYELRAVSITLLGVWRDTRYDVFDENFC